MTSDQADQHKRRQDVTGHVHPGAGTNREQDRRRSEDQARRNERGHGRPPGGWRLINGVPGIARVDHAAFSTSCPIVRLALSHCVTSPVRHAQNATTTGGTTAPYPTTDIKSPKEAISDDAALGDAAAH